MQDSLDHLHAQKRQEIERLFPEVVSEVNALCSGDLIALLQRTFDESRDAAWRKIIAKYSNNPYLGNFFADTIESVYEAKKFSYTMRRDNKELFEGYRKLFSNVHDDIVADLLTAVLLKRCRNGLVLDSAAVGTAMKTQAVKLLVELAQANTGEKMVLPKDMTLEYALRAIFEKKLSFVVENGG